jgi:uncharacterized protein (DUF433 family)|tara:strand:+ start:233 stop:493 length:261 start_codon:yes stop_codon:yes gene_type:complete
MEKDFMNKIVVNPKVMVGKPIIKGTRITVEAIVGRVAEGMAFDEILEDFPYITEDDIKAALMYAQSLVAGEEIIPIIIKGKHAVSS